MQSNLSNDIKLKQALRDKLQADVDAAIAAGKSVTVGEPFGAIQKQLPPLTPVLSQKKRLTMKDVAKRFKGGANGKA